MMRYALWAPSLHGPIRLALLDARTLEQACDLAKEKAQLLVAVNARRLPALDTATMWLTAQRGGAWTLAGVEPEECEDNACACCAWCARDGEGQ